MDYNSLKPWVITENGGKELLSLACKKDDAYYFYNADKSISLKIELIRSSDTTAVYTKAEIYRNDAFCDDCAIGIDVNNPDTDYMASVLAYEHWCKPFFGNKLSEIPNNTQGLLLKSDKTYKLILPVCDEKYKCIIVGNENGFTFKLFSWYKGLTECCSLAFVIAEAENPFLLPGLCVKRGLELLDNNCKTIEQREYPDIFEYLGWCSWDAFQIKVSEKSLLDKCKEFKEKDIPVRWIVIDDMWGNTLGLNDIPENVSFDEMIRKMYKCKLTSFEADPVRFHNGLKHCISKIKGEFKLKVGMWHPTTGYWNGIDENGEIALKFMDLLIVNDNGKLVHSPQFEKAKEFYNAYHSFLKECGADFVKVDKQSCIRAEYKGELPVGEAARNLHKAIESSTSNNFNNNLINCMGMASENMWNRPSSAISRCTTDFLPENREWFAQHILQAIYSSYILGSFMWCDFDMWWTDDNQAKKNSVLKAVSGGPVYLSDKLGRSKKDVIMPLVLSNGKVLRCDRPALPTKECLLENPETSQNALKIWNRCNESGVVASFNVNNKNTAVKGTVSPSDVDGLLGNEFVIYEHFSKKIKILNKNECLDYTLHNQDDFRLFIIVPIVNGFAPIGLIDKFISPKTIKRVKGNKVELYEEGIYAYVKDRKLVICEGEFDE